ncbi:MAG TPA: DUF1800 domain-containing protein [Phycisphaerales bacterium]|nr:DUF1800 domain-containing protein [Phycisphaerales bacterium]
MPSADKPARTSALSPLRAESFGYAEARHLLWRAGFGGTPDQVQLLVEWGPERSVDHLIEGERGEGEPVEAGRFDSSIMGPPDRAVREQLRRARQGNDEELLARLRLERQRREETDRRQARDIQRWWLTRMIESPRPLEEKMTLFWHGHFATSYRTIEDSYHMFAQNQLFRAHALGNYGTLMYQIIRDPAMLAYLDNNDSRKNRPNENLARELMELFSLGPGNYTEGDIKEGARSLTGYTFEDDRFEFQRENHDGGAKVILGKRGNMDGDEFVRTILDQPACAYFMARKLYRFFAADVPERGEIDPETAEVLREMANLLRRAGYAVAPVLKKLLLSEHFYSGRVVNQRIKSPAELLVGAVRSLRTPTRDLDVLLDAMALMGQNILFPPSVAGWDGERSWINTSTLFVRQNILAYLITGKTPRGYDSRADRERYDPSAVVGRLAGADPAAAKDPDRVIDYLLRFALGQAPEHARAPLQGFVAANGGGIGDDMVIGILLLITAMPEYQLT